MEYIEREAAVNAVLNLAPKVDDDGYCWVIRGDAARAIDSIPAADVRPAVRGKWTGNKRHQSCSECHMTYCVPDGQDGELDLTAYHFCPNCGAEMEES